MSNKTYSYFTTSDALLPLLDVATLLLGLFIVLFTAATMQDKENAGKNEPAGAPESRDDMGIPNNILIIQVDRNADINVRIKGEMQKIGAHELTERLKSEKRQREDILVLLAIENPWDIRSNAVYEEASKSIREAGLRYSRVY